MSPPVWNLLVHHARRQFQASWLIAGAIIVALGGSASLVLGHGELAAHVEEHTELVQARVQAQVRGTGRVLVRTTDIGIRAVRPPSTGIVLVAGDTTAQPAAWDFAPAGVEPLAPYAPATVRVAVGRWDLELWIRVVAGGIACALGLYTIMTDHHTRWLEILRSWPYSSGVLSMLYLGAGILTLSLLAIGWWVTWSGTLLWFREPSHVSLWSLFGPALLSLWIAYGAGSLAGWVWLNRPPIGALVVVAWVILVVAGPMVLSHLVQATTPVTYEGRMVRERREQYADDLRDLEYKLGEWVLAFVPAGITKPSEIDAIANARFPDLESKWLAALADARARATQIEAQWREARDAQRTWTAAAAWVVPGALLRTVMADQVGTGPFQVASWEAAVESHQQAINSRVFDDRPTASGRLSIPGTSQGMGLVLLRHDAPRFAELPQLNPPSATLDGAARWSRLAVLMLWAVSLLVAAQSAGARSLRRGPRSLTSA